MRRARRPRSSGPCRPHGVVGVGAVGAAGVLLLLIMSPRLLFGAALAACALLCAAAYIVRVQNERALKQVCDFDSVHFAGRIWFDFKSGIRA